MLSHRCVLILELGLIIYNMTYCILMELTHLTLNLLLMLISLHLNHFINGLFLIKLDEFMIFVLILTLNNPQIL